MKKILLLLLLPFIAISCIKDKEKKGFELKVGDSIPQFSVVMNDGTQLNSSSLCEGVSLIMFFNTNCPDCKRTLPTVHQVYNGYSDKVSFALISREQGNTELSKYWQQNSYTIPYSGQPDRTVYNLFATSLIPRIYICKDGIIRYIYTDTPNPEYDSIVRDINSLL
jgi:thiol-disulfide isomerase/thioredoxin